MTTDYNHQAEKWARDEPGHLSDFIARPLVLESAFRCLSEGDSVLDIGCGEGYFARQLARKKDVKVFGFDSSEEMIRLAKEAEEREHLGITYEVADAREEFSFHNQRFDLCIGNFIVQYLKPEELENFYEQISMRLNVGSSFLLSFPHPVINLSSSIPRCDAVNMEKEEFDYIQSRGDYFPGTVTTVQGKTLEVGFCHSTLEDHFKALPDDLFISNIIEPIVTKELTDKFPLFKPLEGKTPYIIIEGHKGNYKNTKKNNYF